MASRVNTRFVIILIVGVIALLGMLMLAWSVAHKSASDLVGLGDQLMVEGDYKRAERHYAKAVHKDATNTENLNKWIDSLEHIVPDTETEYRDRFYNDYIGAIKKTSTILRNNSDAHERFLVIRHEILKTQYSRGLADVLIEDTNGALAFFNEDPLRVGEWERLKRYRGLAIVRIAKGNGLLNDDQYILAQDDLERAIAANPSDVESVIGLMNIVTIIANREIPEYDKEARIGSLRAGRSIGQAFLDSYPKNVEMAIQMIFIEAEITRKEIETSAEGEALIIARKASLATFQDQIIDIANELLSDSRDQLDVGIVKLFFTLETAISPDSNISYTRRMIDTLIDSNKDDAELLLVAGSLAKGADELEEALGWYSRIADLETQAVSFHGFRQYSIKRDALHSQVTIKIDQAQALLAEGSQDEIDAAIADATEKRDLFAAAIQDDNLALVIIDGKIARTSGNLEEALRLFKKFNELTRRENLEGLWQEGITASQLKQYGVARDALVELIPLDTTNRKILAMLTLAQIHEQLQDYEAAAGLYSDVLAINPTINVASVSLDRMNKFINPELNDDPVIAAIMTARQIRLGSSSSPADFPGAIEYLRNSIDGLGYDPRISRELASILFDQNDVKGSMEVLNKALELHPDEEWITTTLQAMNSDDPIGSRIAMVRQADGDQVSKLLTIAKIAFENDRKGLFIETMIELNTLDPNNKGVIEMSFINAVKYGNIDDAKAIAQRTDLSQTESLSFRARIAIIENDPAKAIDYLKQATATGTADASVFQMLAIIQRDSGNFTDAIQSFESSLAISPNNPKAIADYLIALVRAGQSETALSAARRLQRFGSSDINFMNLWLNLESLFGGEQGRAFAINQRERMLELNPNNIENKGQLAQMYITSKKWDESRALIDDIRATNDNLKMVELDATWHADQGIVNNRNGLVLANELYTKYIETLESPVGTDPYISNAEFMLNRGRPDLAVIAANEAVKRQSPDTMLGSKLLGDLYMRINNHSKAVEAYQEVIASGADTDFKVRNRLIGTYTNLQRYEDAQGVLNQLPEEMKTEMITMLQAADIARGMDDNALASKLLDDAVARYPTNSYVYVKRAESMIGDESLLNDMLSDLGRALDIQSNDWRAYRVRAAGFFALDRREEALKDLQAAVRINPSLDKSIFAILNELLTQPGRSGEAMDVARDVLSRRADDANLMSRIGGLFASRKEWNKAAEIHGMAWNKRHSISDGAVYIDSLVRMTPPDAQTANKVLNELTDIVGNINESAGLLAAQALILQARGREDFAKQQITKAFDLSVKKDSDLVGWSGNLSRYFEDQPAQDHYDYLESLKRRNTDPDIQTWLELFIVGRMIIENETNPASFEILERLMGYSENPNIQIRAYKLFGALLYSQDKFGEAAAAWQDGIKLFSDDWEMNNNLAYVLSTKLDRHDEALSYGQTAIDQNLARSEAYETMAGIYIRLGKFDEAEQMIDIGSNYLLSIPASVTMLITNGRLHLARGNMIEAHSSLTDARAVLRSSPTAHPSLKTDIEEFEQEINSAED